MKFLPAAPISFLFCLLLLSMSLGQVPVFGDPDTAWHIAAGDVIRETGSIPVTDPWSFTASAERWYNLSWLFDIGLSWLYEWGNFTALYVLTLCAFAAALTFMAWHCMQREANIGAVFAAALLALYTVHMGIYARPNVCSVLLMVLFYHLLYRFRDTGSWRLLLPLPPLMALWVNLHGGFLLAFMLIGFFLAEAMLERNAARAKLLSFAGVACLAATLANPYGTMIYHGALRSILSGFGHAYVHEWQSVKIGSYLPMTLFLLVMLCIGNVWDRRIPLIDRMLSVVLLMAALSSMRMTIIVPFLLMPYISLRISYLLQESGFTVALPHALTRPGARILGTACAILALAFLSTPFPREKVIGNVMGLPTNGVPSEEASYVLNRFPTLRFFNDYYTGSYLDFLTLGKIKVFIDGRANSVYSPALLKDYQDFINAKGFGPNAQRIVQKYKLNGLILSNQLDGMDIWFANPQWVPVYRGAVATVFLNRPLAEKIAKAKAAAPSP